MIDLHCHMLPGIDDGPEDMQTSLEMARFAVEHGITHVVCTPHIHPGRYENSAASIQQACSKFATALKSAGIKLKVSSAAEVRFDSQIMTGVKDGSIPFLGEWEGRKAILLEFPHGEIPFGAERMTRWLLKEGIMPVLAHPERNKGLMLTPSKLKPFIQQGCLLQLTAGSIAGAFGESAQRLAHHLLKQGVVSLIATDAHNIKYRPPELKPGLSIAEKILGEREAKQLVLDTPWRISQGHFV
ncbi:MAG TPA: capsular biosynthesis protein [Pseudomonas xinjiangensis]|uniref:protein-tyrosine-phosphatase n=1 Tax=Halopseudomonas xinjiangensis TaxID=487184 RepID=A0A7V1FTK9_9GAMM|nr:capsular biosynthesis protein [Halopseudomonas xinjiangensis]HEC47889.1 capsular biosynthesis protein [Halopseudomonas xinjiangensis]